MTPTRTPFPILASCLSWLLAVAIFQVAPAMENPVTDGQRVVTLFGTAGLLVAYDMNGELLWTKDLGLLDSGHFYAPAVQKSSYFYAKHRAQELLTIATFCAQAE